jgi:uracil-DNA glycosylase
VSTTAPGQEARVSFTGRAGQRLNVGISQDEGLSISNSAILYAPDGKDLVAVSRSDRRIAAVLPADGTYTIGLYPRGASTLKVTLALSAAVNVSATVGDPAISVSTTAPGQEARVSFTGRAGQRLNVGISQAEGLLYSDVAFLYAPDGKELGYFQRRTAAVLPADGTYTIGLYPDGASTLKATLALSETLDGGSATVGGPAISVSTTAPGQEARVSFTGRAGQRLNVGISQDEGLSDFRGIILYAPDDEPLEEVDARFERRIDAILPADGTYTIGLYPRGASTLKVTLTLGETP